MWAAALDALPRDVDAETVDQKIAYATALALLSISQEISRIGQAEAPFTEELLGVIGALGQSRGPKGTAW